MALGSPETFPKEGHVLFSIPRTLTLSTRSCALPDLFGNNSWTSFQLHRGWAGLILCMMWEESRAEQSEWFQYLCVSPFHMLALIWRFTGSESSFLTITLRYTDILERRGIRRTPRNLRSRCTRSVSPLHKHALEPKL